MIPREVFSSDPGVEMTDYPGELLVCFPQAAHDWQTFWTQGSGLDQTAPRGSIPAGAASEGVLKAHEPGNLEGHDHKCLKFKSRYRLGRASL